MPILSPRLSAAYLKNGAEKKPPGANYSEGLEDI